MIVDLWDFKIENIISSYSSYSSALKRSFVISTFCLRAYFFSFSFLVLTFNRLQDFSLQWYNFIYTVATAKNKIKIGNLDFTLHRRKKIIKNNKNFCFLWLKSEIFLFSLQRYVNRNVFPTCFVAKREKKKKK